MALLGYPARTGGSRVHRKQPCSAMEVPKEEEYGLVEQLEAEYYETANSSVALLADRCYSPDLDIEGHPGEALSFGWVTEDLGTIVLPAGVALGSSCLNRCRTGYVSVVDC